MQPIYYYELDLVINMARSSIVKNNTWFISTVPQDALKTHFKAHSEDFDSFLYIAFKKGLKAVKSKKIVSFDINIKSVKQIGFTNN